MSLNPDLFKNPLIRDGVSQRQRQTASSALSPDFVKLDEWELADALVFAYQLSQKVRYYDGQDGKESGNWKEFFTTSTPIQIALISKTRPQIVKASYDQKLQSFLENPSNNTLRSILDFWKTSVLSQILQWYQNLESYTPLKSAIQGLVKTNLTESLMRIRGLEKGYSSQPTSLAQVSTVTVEDFAQQFGLELTTIPTYQKFFDNDRVTQQEELDAVFQKLFQTYRQIIQDAPKYLDDSLEKWQEYPPSKDNPKRQQDHPPHLALYYVFWEILRYARDDLNLMTQKHLDFFYRKVLNLKDRPAEPDHAHLLFELAKLPTLTEFKLPLGTRFKAGKDAIGKELIYKLDEDIVVHKAKITSLKGLFIETRDSQTRVDPQTKKPLKLIVGVHESPIINSADGKGKPFPKEQVIQSWLPFGDTSRDAATLGLAIAADVLLLKEGNRTITLTLTLRETSPDSAPNSKEKFADLTDAELQKLFTVKVSGKEKDWTEAQLISATRTSPTTSIYQLTLTIKLTADQSPLLPYRNTLPGAVLPTTKPVLLLILNPAPADRINNLAPYHFLHTLQLNDLKIDTTVDQIRDLMIQNDLAVLDASKPFQPFGPQPKAGSSLYIGSQEVFQKNLTQLTIKLGLEEPKPPIGWQEIYGAYDSAMQLKPGSTNEMEISSNFVPGKLTIQALHQREWSSPAVISNLFDLNISLASSELTTLKLTSSVDSQPVEAWTYQSQNGFLRLQLAQEATVRSDFLHNEYPTVLARQMVAVAAAAQQPKKVVGRAYYLKDAVIRRASDTDTSIDGDPIIPKEPYLPVVRSLSISYSAIAEKKDCTLFHLCPFDGFVELKTENPYFLTQLTDSGTLFEGELLIGLQDLDPPTALPLLFQVVEESADTKLKKTAVEWFYLENNDWHSISDRIVSDTTNGLVASGIVHLRIPDDISPDKVKKTQNTILDPTLYWIKARVTERSGAICEIINVHTQAARVIFTDEGNDPNHLAVPLKAGEIAKFEVPQLEIKTVEQPYAAFGGKLKELPQHFYLRVSEQLRHKGRAVTIFDYERLVLEKFPEIYKVRCINHGLLDESQNSMYELVPGGVTLAVIPDLSKPSSFKDLEPKVNVNLLDQIKDYVAGLSSPWAEIKVVNPKYEKIKITCKVKFKSPYDANFGYYSRALNQAITNFLAPWTQNAQAEIQFGGRLYYSAVLDFIEQQDYVDYVIDFTMNLDSQVNVREAIASTPRSVLTSEIFHSIEEFKDKDAESLPSQRLPQPNLLGYKALKELTIDQE